MKKISKFLVVALTVALLLGAVIGISAMANDEPAAPAAQAEGSWIISWNVEYNDNLYLMCAIDGSKVGEGDELSVDVTFGGIVVDNSGFKIEKATIQGKAVYTVKTIGVAAKDMADALEIDVKLNGEVVESTSYSVAEYFFQRLYKDEAILATEGEALAQKELYLSSLKYGNAAQKLLAAADPLYIENTVYLYSTNDKAVSLLDASEYLELEDGYYQVKSYVNGEAVESVVDGGKYIVQNSAQITKIEVKTPEYFIPAGATTFDSAAVGTFANATKVGDEAFGTGKQANAIWTTEIKVDEATGNKYINHTKTGNKEGATGNQMSWFVVQRTETVAAKEDVYFEARANITITKGTTTHIRLYDSTRTASKTDDGKPLLSDSERIYIVLREHGKA